MTNPLADIARDLEYAATTGAARLAASVVAQGKTDAEVGAAIASDGPGVRQLLARSGVQETTVEAAQMPLGRVVGEMAESITDGGVELALGKRR